MADLTGPIRGTDEMLNRVLERSADAIALHRALKSLVLFGSGATQASKKDHPLVSAILVWRDRYVRSQEVITKAEGALEHAKTLTVSDADQYARAMESALSSLDRYQTASDKILGEIRDTIQSALTVLAKTEKHDLDLVVNEVKRLRAIITLEGRKAAAGVRSVIPQAVRVSALALMQARERLVAPGGIPLGAETGEPAEQAPPSDR